MFGDSSEMELHFYDVILEMDCLPRHRVVLDCLRIRVDIVGPDESFVACMLHAKELLDIEADGFSANILMVKDDGQHEL